MLRVRDQVKMTQLVVFLGTMQWTLYIKDFTRAADLLGDLEHSFELGKDEERISELHVIVPSYLFGQTQSQNHLVIRTEGDFGQLVEQIEKIPAAPGGKPTQVQLLCSASLEKKFIVKQ
jgi:hypothetical protein